MSIPILSARYLMTLTPEERDPFLEAAVSDAVPLYEADLRKPEAERELTADLETGDFHNYGYDEAAERLYKIQNNIYRYFTGYLSNGNQILMSSVCVNSDGKETETPTFPMVEFDKEGNLHAVRMEEMGVPSHPLPFTPGTISVKKFFVLDHYIGITDLPEHYQQFLDHLESASEDENLHYPDEISAWLMRGDFVLWCNEDYYLNKDGELESS